MATLLVLGSKPDPCLPPLAEVDDVACANGSGRSAAQLGLPTPTFTVMSAVLTSGQASGRHTIAALGGLATGELFYYPRPEPTGAPWRRALRRLRQRRMRLAVLRRALAAVGYRYERMSSWDHARYMEELDRLAGGDPALRACVAEKQPSSGLMALVVGLSLARWDRYIVAGMSFELTHAYGENPDIRERGTLHSKHADTDVTALAALALRHPGLATTEEVVHRRAGVPLWRGAGVPVGSASNGAGGARQRGGV